MNPKLNEMLPVVGHLQKVKKLKKMLEAGWINTHDFYDIVLRVYRKYLKENNCDPDNPSPFLPAKREDWVPKPAICLGFTMNGLPVGISLKDLCRGGIIATGRMGSGKTTLFINVAKLLKNIKGVACWFFETSKYTFRNVFDDDVLVITPPLLRWNRWIEPKGTNPVLWHTELVTQISNAHGMLNKGRQFLHKIVTELDQQYGVIYGSRFRWSDMDVIKKVNEKISSKSWEVRETAAKWMIRLAPNEAYSKQFSSDKSLDMVELMNRDVIFEFTDFSRSLQSDLISSLLWFKLFYKRHNPGLLATANVNFIDETQNLISEDNITLTDSPIYSAMKIGREYRETFIMGEQLPKNLGDLIKIAHLVVILQQSDFSLRFFQMNTTMPIDQVNYLKHLSVGHAITTLPEKPPVEIKIPLQEIERSRTDEEIERIMEPALEKFLVQRPRGKIGPMFREDKKSDVILEKTSRPEERELWTTICKRLVENPLSSVGDLGKGTGYKGQYISRQLEFMTDQTLLAGSVTNVPTGSKGGPGKTVHVLSKRGADFIGAGYSKLLKGKGGLRSRVYARIIGDYIKHNGGTPKYEFSLKKGAIRKACDVADVHDPNKIIAFEFDNTSFTVNNNILKNRTVGFHKTIVVMKNDKEIKKLARELKKLDPECLGSIEPPKTIKEFV
jgi:hypothetical protein